MSEEANESRMLGTGRSTDPDVSGLRFRFVLGYALVRVLLFCIHERIVGDPSQRLPIGRLVQDDRGFFILPFASLRSGIAF